MRSYNCATTNLCSSRSELFVLGRKISLVEFASQSRHPASTPGVRTV